MVKFAVVLAVVTALQNCISADSLIWRLPALGRRRQVCSMTASARATRRRGGGLGGVEGAR